MSVNQRSLEGGGACLRREAWSTPEAAVRRELLDMSLAEDGTYTDPATRCGAKRSLRTSLAAP